MNDTPAPPSPPPNPAIVVQPEFKKGRRYTLEDMEAIVSGEAYLPNVESVDPGHLLNNIASMGHMMTPRWGYAMISVMGIDANRKQWTQFFLLPSEGTGYAITYGNPAAITVRFAICKHKMVEGPGANHSRGWHPGWCEKCGLDMSVDSGD